jgi:hypothetical protein
MFYIAYMCVCPCKIQGCTILVFVVVDTPDTFQLVKSSTYLPYSRCALGLQSRLFLVNFSRRRNCNITLFGRSSYERSGCRHVTHCCQVVSCFGSLDSVVSDVVYACLRLCAHVQKYYGHNQIADEMDEVCSTHGSDETWL